MLRRRWGCDVTVLVATRGEGGQNAVGPEHGPELGRIRTRETVAAAALLDVKVRFLDLPDFGYTRTAAEALDQWRAFDPAERLSRELADLRPDLVVIVHGPREAHGQKRAVLHLTRQCVARLERPPRLFRGAGVGETPSVELDLDVPDSKRGRTYQEQAYQALRQHRTQQPHAAIDDAAPRRVKLKREGPGKSSLLDGLPGVFDAADDIERWLKEIGSKRTGAWIRERFEDLPEIPDQPALLREFDPTRLATELLRVLKALHGRAPVGGDVARRLGRRIAALERAVLAGAVIRMTWHGDEAFAPGKLAVGAPLRIWNGGRSRIVARVLGLARSPSDFSLAAPNGRTLVVDPGHRKELALELSRPTGRDLGAAHVVLDVRVELADGTPLRVELSRDVGSLRPLIVEPLPQSDFLVSDRGGEIRMMMRFLKPVGLVVRGELAKIGTPAVSLLPEFGGKGVPVAVELHEALRELRLPIRLRVAAWPRDAGQAVARPLQFYVVPVSGGPPPPASRCMVRIHPVALRVPVGLRVGLVRGPDNTIEEALRSFGIDVHPLEERSLARASLDDYDTILIGSRALLRRKHDLVPQTDRFVSYARGGKHLVVLYHKAQEFNRDATSVRLAPFPIELGRERVTREDAPIEVLEPRHHVMSAPNHIGPGDWDGWVQERGLYFPAKYDSRYSELLSIQELPMEELAAVEATPRMLRFAPQRGALLAARCGRGSYVYCALVIHRQLRAFHAGAARLLVNMVTPPDWRVFR